MRTRIVLLGALLVAGLAACGHSSSHGAPAAHGTDAPNAAAASPGGIEVEQSSLGPILADRDGRTLYAFVNDKGGTSTCTDQCIATWPALVSRQSIAAGTGVDSKLLSHTTRTEGTDQATYNEWPLYYYVGDVGPGDVDGQGVDGVWFVVGADGKLIKTTP